MRNVYLNVSGYENCCRISIIEGFNNTGGSIGRKPFTDDEWFRGIEELDDSIITFAHSSRENHGPCTPKVFAEWLRSKGEEVVEIQGKVRGKNAHITLYTCALSAKFKKARDKNQKKRDAEENNGGDDTF